jgi:hypothetical protein
MKHQITEGFAQDSTDVLAFGTTFFRNGRKSFRSDGIQVAWVAPQADPALSYDQQLKHPLSTSID